MGRRTAGGHTPTQIFGLRPAVCGLRYYSTMFENIRPDSDDDALGYEHIIEAAYGRRSLTDIQEAIMGEPTLQDFGAAYHNDLKVVIPLEIEEDIDLAPLVFDVPESPDLSGDLGRFAANYGVESVDNIDLLADSEVPLTWDGGSPAPDWLLL